MSVAPTETQPITTAAALIAFRKELVEGGFDCETADAMCRDAAHSLIASDGTLAVRNA